jgi:cytoskeletal protein CcmA (bactofilin family)
MPAPVFRNITKAPDGRGAKAPDGRGRAELPTSELGTALTVVGVLDTDGELFIHGNVQGRINAERLVLGQHGNVEGDIVARDVHIGGRLNGRVFALNVTLDDTADVSGRIFHNTVTVAKGARIDGRMPWRPPSYFEALDDQLPETKS